MAYESKDGTGALFKNERKEHERQPDYRGNAMVNGRAVDVAGWIRTGQSGKTYLSLKFSEPRDQEERKPAPAAKDKPDADFPF